MLFVHIDARNGFLVRKTLSSVKKIASPRKQESRDSLWQNGRYLTGQKENKNQ